MKISNKGFIIGFAGLLCICIIVVFLSRFFTPGKKLAVIKVDGEIYQKIQLDESLQIDTIVIDKEGYNELLLEQDGVTMVKADCPDQICVHQGKITSGTAPIVCLPNRVSVSIVSGGKEQEPDAVSGR